VWLFFFRYSEPRFSDTDAINLPDKPGPTVPNTMTEPTPPTSHDMPADAADALPASSVGSGVSDVAGAMKRSSKPSHDPFGLRTLIISWCLWLLVSWSITLAIGATAHAVRWVIFSAVFGLMAVWPALRLSQQLPGRDADTGAALADSVEGGAATTSVRVWATMLDWICLMLVFQVVIWPLMLVGRWSAEQTLWLDLAVVFWSSLSAVLIGLGRVLPLPGVRVWAMLLCMLLLVGEPVLMAIGGISFDSVGSAGRSGSAVWQMRISPLQAMWELTTTVRPYDPTVWRPTILSTAAASGLGWCVLWGMVLWRCSRPQGAAGPASTRPT
jgi:hypothetical protein